MTTEPRIEPAGPSEGLHPRMSETEYRAAPGLNISLLKHMARSPAHCRQEQIAPAEQTPAMEQGAAFHAALLEPAKFHAEWFRAPGVDRRTKVGKDAWLNALAANPGRQPLPADAFDWIERACEKLWSAPEVRALLAGERGLNEVSAFWDLHTDGGVPVRCKGRMDRIAQVGTTSCVVDIKTTTNASQEAFARDVARFAYHTQAAYYLDGLHEIAPRRRDWLWLAVEKDPPYAHAIYQPTADVLALGRSLYKAWLESYVTCATLKSWPGYPSGVTPLELPAWAYRADGF